MIRAIRASIMIMIEAIARPLMEEKAQMDRTKRKRSLNKAGQRCSTVEPFR
jgi:hypothetical protein